MTASPPLKRSERAVVLILRVLAAMAVCALPFVFVPQAWMAEIHAWLGMGELPTEPIVGYLARSTSAFYAMFGGLTWVLTRDVRRHRSPLVFQAVAMLGFGAALLYVDCYEGMPLLWTVSEGPFGILFGSVMLALTLRIERDAPGAR